MTAKADPAALSVLDRSLRTERLVLRPGTVDDTEATWRYRRLDEVNEWLNGSPPDLDGYRELFAEPGRLAATVVRRARRHGPVRRRWLDTVGYALLAEEWRQQTPLARP